MASEQAAGETTAQSFQQHVPTTEQVTTSEQAPVGMTTPEAGGKRTNAVPYEDDEEFNVRVKDRESEVTGCFQKVFSHLERPTADSTPAAETSPATHGTGGTAFKNRWADNDDTIENQLRNTTAQVVGTFKGLTSAFQQAGQKMRGGEKNSDSSEPEVRK